MKGSVQLAKISGIPVRVHWTFGLIFIWIYYTTQTSPGMKSLSIFIWQAAIILALFLFVILHEFGHALTARKFGVKTLDIILSPIGGVARLDRMPPRPLHEFWVALAGPMVNLIIASSAVGIYLLFDPGENFQKLSLMARLVLQPESNVFPGIFNQADKMFAFVIGMNTVLALFNLVPAFPLDGGRILRALLSIRFSRLNATRIAAYIGQLLVIGLFSRMIVFGDFDVMLTFIGAFVFLMAENEYRSVKWEMKLSSYQVQDCIDARVKVLRPDEALTEDLMAAEELTCYFVEDPETHRLMGIISRTDLLDQLKQEEPPPTIEGIWKPIKHFVKPEESLLSVVTKIRESGEDYLPVLQADKPIGVVNLDKIEALINPT